MKDATHTLTLQSLGSEVRVAVVGATGGIGQAVAALLSDSPNIAQVHRLGRSPKPGHIPIDLTDEESVRRAAQSVSETGPLHAIVVATGLLHDGPEFQPEKTWKALDRERLLRSFEVNTIGPALVAKHFLPLLARDRKTVFAALSARVGSISDNRIGGWYGYRASKAALNMIITNLAIEFGRTRKEAVIVGLHPGTVDTALSQPFQGAVPATQVVPPEESARNLLSVLDTLQPEQSGRVFAWDGQEVPA